MCELSLDHTKVEVECLKPLYFCTKSNYNYNYNYNANRPTEDDTEVELVIDFYQRFLYRMEYMMKVGKEKGYNLISFMGP